MHPLCAVALALIVRASTVLAGSVTYISSTSVPDGPTDWTGELTFPRFDGSLGTLTGVEVDASLACQTQYTITNNAASASSGSVATEIEVNVRDPDGYWSGQALLVDAVLPTYHYSLGPGGTITSPLYSASQGGSIVDSSSQVLAEFSGSGTITTIALSASSLTQTVAGNTGGNSAVSQSSTAGLTGSITYSYDVPSDLPVVPAPAILSSCGAALSICALVGLAHRNRRNILHN